MKNDPKAKPRAANAGLGDEKDCQSQLLHSSTIQIVPLVGALMARVPYRYVPLPVDLLNDARLKSIDIRVFGVLLDVERDGLAHISLDRIGKRVARGERAVGKIMRRLELAGWISTIDNGIGNCRDHRLLTPVTQSGGVPPSRAAGVETPTRVVGDAEPPSSATKTPVVDGTLSIRSLDKLSIARGRAPEEEIKDDEMTTLLNALLESLKLCYVDKETAEKEGERLANLYPQKLFTLSAHIRYAALEDIPNPVAYAERATQREETPRFSGKTAKAVA